MNSKFNKRGSFLFLKFSRLKGFERTRNQKLPSCACTYVLCGVSIESMHACMLFKKASKKSAEFNQRCTTNLETAHFRIRKLGLPKMPLTIQDDREMATLAAGWNSVRIFKTSPYGAFRVTSRTEWPVKIRNIYLVHTDIVSPRFQRQHSQQKTDNIITCPKTLHRDIMEIIINSVVSCKSSILIPRNGNSFFSSFKPTNCITSF